MTSTLEISVPQYNDEKNGDGNRVTTYYIVNVKVVSTNISFSFRKRYSEFAILCNRLMKLFKFKLTYPPKTLLRSTAESDSVKLSRRISFDLFVKGMVQHVTNHELLFNKYYCHGHFDKFYLICRMFVC